MAQSSKHRDRRNGGDARAAVIAPNISSPWASMDKDLVDLIGWRVLESDMLNYVRPLPRRLHQLVAFQHQVLNFLGAVWRGDIPRPTSIVHHIYTCCFPKKWLVYTCCFGFPSLLTIVDVPSERNMFWC